MASIISIQSLQEFDYDAAVDEVELLVPKYLKCLQLVEKEERLEAKSDAMKNVVTYWKRLSFLITQIQELEEDPSLESARINALQSELQLLERVYLKVNERIHLSENQWSKAMWEVASIVLRRMDAILEELGFDKDHKDRGFIREIIEKNLVKEGSVAS